MCVHVHMRVHVGCVIVVCARVWLYGVTTNKPARTSNELVVALL